MNAGCSSTAVRQQWSGRPDEDLIAASKALAQARAQDEERGFRLRDAYVRLHPERSLADLRIVSDKDIRRSLQRTTGVLPAGGTTPSDGELIAAAKAQVAQREHAELDRFKLQRAYLELHPEFTLSDIRRMPDRKLRESLQTSIATYGSWPSCSFCTTAGDRT